MGCRDRESNFNTFHYKNGKWGVSWGYELTFEAPTKAILEEELQKWRGVWFVQPTRKGTLIAREGAIQGQDQGVFYSKDC